jgi:hypothetical protein
VVLACAEGLDNQAVAKKLRCSKGMVGKWRSRFLEARLEGLYDEPRPGAPRKVNAEVERVVIQTLESTHRRLVADPHSDAPHHEYIASEAAKGLAQASLSSGVPIAFGVLTTDTLE